MSACFLHRAELQVGVVLILQNLPLLHLAMGHTFCCVTPSNIRDVFSGNQRFGGSACQSQGNREVPRSSIPTQPLSTLHAATTEAGSEVAITSCTDPVDCGVSTIMNTLTPMSSVANTPSVGKTRQAALEPLRALDIFHGSSSQFGQVPMSTSALDFSEKRATTSHTVSCVSQDFRSSGPRPQQATECTGTDTIANLANSSLKIPIHL